MIERNIHHQGNPPSRTCIGAPVQSAWSGLWSAHFVRWRGIAGEEVYVSKITSAALFPTKEEALDAADRAMDALQLKGTFPNMCEKF